MEHCKANRAMPGQVPPSTTKRRKMQRCHFLIFLNHIQHSSETGHIRTLRIYNSSMIPNEYSISPGAPVWRLYMIQRKYGMSCSTSVLSKAHQHLHIVRWRMIFSCSCGKHRQSQPNSFFSMAISHWRRFVTISAKSEGTIGTGKDPGRITTGTITAGSARCKHGRGQYSLQCHYGQRQSSRLMKEHIKGYTSCYIRPFIIPVSAIILDFYICSELPCFLENRRRASQVSSRQVLPHFWYCQ